MAGTIGKETALMSTQEKRILLTLLAEIALLAVYCSFTASKVQSGDASLDDLKFWAVNMLIFTGLGVLALVIIQILFHILFSIGIAVKTQIETGGVDNKALEQTLETEMAEDERDKLIGMKAQKISVALAGIGFVAGLLTLLADYPPAVMLNVFYLSFVVGSILEGAAQLFFYRRGVRNA
jgi:hypothetical protein